MQGVLNIHALIEGHTRFETKKVRLKQTINMCFIKKHPQFENCFDNPATGGALSRDYLDETKLMGGLNLYPSP